MPIINIQRRMAEQGRIRLGVKAPVGTNGKTRPAKLDRFRFTSPNADLIAAIAQQYGGEAKPWDNGGKPEHEVITDATSVPVIVVKGGLSQWMETWSGGGCVHRCDGEHNVLTDAPCNLQDPNHANAKPTTRLSVMLTDIESLGVWRMETHGWNAAAEIPAMAELAMHVGDLVPATLHLVERRAIRDGKTSRFVVPVLDLQVTKRRLVELVGGTGSTPALAEAPAAERVAIEVPRPDYTVLLADTTSPEECTALWHQAGAAGHLDDDLKAAITARVQHLRNLEEVADESGEGSWPDDSDQPAEGEVVEAEVVEDDDQGEVVTLWQQALAKAGAKGIGGADLAKQVMQVTGRKTEQCSADDFRAVLHFLDTGEVPEGATA